MTRETICQECSGAGFYGGNGPIVQTICSFCNGTGVLVEESQINVRAVSRIDELQAKHIVGSVFARMTRAEGRTLFHQMEEYRRHKEGFGR
jgi:DnaJ-class molecular chaperone